MTNGDNKNLIIDPQHNRIYQLPKKVVEYIMAKELDKSRFPKSDFTTRLYALGIVKKGIFGSCLSGNSLPVEYNLNSGKYEIKDIGLKKDIPKNLLLGDLIIKAEAGDKESEEKILSIAYNAMAYGDFNEIKTEKIKDYINEKKTKTAAKTVEEKKQNLTKLKNSLDYLKLPKIGTENGNDKLKSSLGYLLRVAVIANESDVISPTLFKGIMICGAELSLLLNEMDNPDYIDLPEDEKEEILTQYFDVLKKFQGLFTSAGESGVISDSLAIALNEQVKYKKLAEKLLGGNLKENKVYPKKIEYLTQVLKLRDFALNEKIKEKWDSFCTDITLKGTLSSKNSPTNKLSALLKILSKLNIHNQWLNIVFSEKDLSNPEKALGSMISDFKDLDIILFEDIITKLTSMKSQIPVWSEPDKFEKLFKEFESNLKYISDLLDKQWIKTTSAITKFTICEQLSQLVDVIDLSVKSLENSKQYPKYDNDRLKIERVRAMLCEFNKVHDVWVRKTSYFGDGNTTQKANYVCDTLNCFFNNETTTKLTLQSSSTFNVTDFTINNPSSKKLQLDLEDAFTLMHQNMLIAISNINSENCLKLISQFPECVKKIYRKIVKSCQYAIKINCCITTTIEFNPSKSNIILNLPLNQHSCRVTIKYDKINGTSVNVHFCPSTDSQSRYINIYNFSCTYVLLKGLKFVSKSSPPVFNRTINESVYFDIKTNNNDDSKKVVDLIAKTISIANRNSPPYLDLYKSLSNEELENLTEDGKNDILGQIYSKPKIFIKNPNNLSLKFLKTLPADVILKMSEVTGLTNETNETLKNVQELAKNIDIIQKQIIDFTNGSNNGVLADDDNLVENFKKLSHYTQTNFINKILELKLSDKYRKFFNNILSKENFSTLDSSVKNIFTNTPLEENNDIVKIISFNLSTILNSIDINKQILFVQKILRSNALDIFRKDLLSVFKSNNDIIDEYTIDSILKSNDKELVNYIKENGLLYFDSILKSNNKELADSIKENCLLLFVKNENGYTLNMYYNSEKCVFTGELDKIFSCENKDPNICKDILMYKILQSKDSGLIKRFNELVDDYDIDYLSSMILKCNDSYLIKYYSSKLEASIKNGKVPLEKIFNEANYMDLFFDSEAKDICNLLKDKLAGIFEKLQGNIDSKIMLIYKIFGLADENQIALLLKGQLASIFEKLKGDETNKGNLIEQIFGLKDKAKITSLLTGQLASIFENLKDDKKNKKELIREIFKLKNKSQITLLLKGQLASIFEKLNDDKENKKLLIWKIFELEDENQITLLLKGQLASIFEKLKDDEENKIKLIGEIPFLNGCEDIKQELKNIINGGNE